VWHPAGNGSAALQFAPAGADHQYVVEQQSPLFFFSNCGIYPLLPECDPAVNVVNPTECGWDVDDFTDFTAFGSLAGGETASQSLCVIEDGFNNYGGDTHSVQVLVTSSSPGLEVTLSNTFNGAARGAPAPSGKEYQYLLCVLDPTAGGYAEIPGSHGGTGLRVDYTLTIRNPKRQQAKVRAFFQMQSWWGVGNLSIPCPPGTHE